MYKPSYSMPSTPKLAYVAIGYFQYKVPLSCFCLDYVWHFTAIFICESESCKTSILELKSGKCRHKRSYSMPSTPKLADVAIGYFQYKVLLSCFCLDYVWHFTARLIVQSREKFIRVDREIHFRFKAILIFLFI